MDGTDLSGSILVEVTGDKPLLLEKPGDPDDRRTARAGDQLFGREVRQDDVTWILFADGYAIRKSRLKVAWDDDLVEAWAWDGNRTTGEMF